MAHLPKQWGRTTPAAGDGSIPGGEQRCRLQAGAGGGQEGAALWKWPIPVASRQTLASGPCGGLAGWPTRYPGCSSLRWRKIAERAIAERRFVSVGTATNLIPAFFRRPGAYVRFVSVGAETNLSPSFTQTGHSGPAVLHRCGGTYWSDFTMAPVIWSVKSGRRGGVQDSRARGVL